MKKVGFAIHAYSDIPFEVYASHLAASMQMIKDGFEHGFNSVFLGLFGYKVAAARNIIVENAIKQNCSHIIFLDSDHVVPQTIVSTLLSCDVPVVSGLATFRKAPYKQVGYVLNVADKKYLPINITKENFGKIYDVDICAFGCTLIDLNVFKNMPQPYFRDLMVTNEDGTEFNKRSDVLFCEDVRKQGFRICVDTRVRIGHMLDREYVYPDNAESLAEMSGKP